MRVFPLMDLPRFSEITRSDIRIEMPHVDVAIDDEDGKRLRLRFEPYQAVRVTTSDCFDLPDDESLSYGSICEVINSPWIEELQRALTKVDRSAVFLKKARHFLVPLEDDILEVVAWNVTCEDASVAFRPDWDPEPKGT